MKRVVVLTGGVGGAKLVLGLIQVVPPEAVTAIVNTGDDFTHLGLHVSPDIDTLLYTLSGKANAAQGWGREGETWGFMAALRELGGEDWFQLGDGDLALHVLRTEALRRGEPLSSITARFADMWGIGARILPATNDSLATMVDTDEGLLDFQRYFVARRCEPVVRAVRFDIETEPAPAPGVVEAILDAETHAVLIAPSNPFLSIDPILAVPAISDALDRCTAPIVAVSPIVGGQAVKGPTAKMMRELGMPVSALEVARHYPPWLTAMLTDIRDAPLETGIATARADTLMHSLEDRTRVARAALALAGWVS